MARICGTCPIVIASFRVITPPKLRHDDVIQQTYCQSLLRPFEVTRAHILRSRLHESYTATGCICYVPPPECRRLARARCI